MSLKKAVKQIAENPPETMEDVGPRWSKVMTAAFKTITTPVWSALPAATAAGEEAFVASFKPETGAPGLILGCEAYIKAALLVLPLVPPSVTAVGPPAPLALPKTAAAALKGADDSEPFATALSEDLATWLETGTWTDSSSGATGSWLLV